MSNDGLDLVEALLGQILIAVRQQADRGRAAGLAGVLGRHMRVVELEQVEFDLEPGDEIIAALAELVHDRAIKLPRRERHRLAVAEIEIAQHPARARRPRQRAERQGVRHHQRVGGAFHLLQPEAAAGGEHGKHGLVRSVLGKQRGGDAAAAFQRGQRLAGDQRLAAQDAVLVGKGEADGFEFLLFGDRAQAARRLALLRPTTARDARRKSHPTIPPSNSSFRGETKSRARNPYPPARGTMDSGLALAASSSQ